ncbi:unnamed protein product [Lathyrus oleraceus]
MFYEGTKSPSTDVITWLNSFCHYTKRTNRMSGVFYGQSVVVYERNHWFDFERDKKYEVFLYDVRLYCKFTVGFGFDAPFDSGNGTKATNAFDSITSHVNF